MHVRRTILLTGGAGSLGKAFVKLLEPDHKLIVVDNSEWALAELKATFPAVECRLGDFSEYPFSGCEDIVIHLAAFKHVEMGESDPASFVDNNLVKTIRFYQKLQQTLSRVLYVSTDKAVEPISVYGATKMIAEQLTRNIGGQVARLGNILSSSGSVIPLWEKAIAEKRPIPITDPTMTRYMIEADQAVKQIWEQFELGQQLIIPEMGEPVRILDMMAEVLKKHGFEKASDYQPGVEVIGMRPGEKLHEKLAWDSELLAANGN